MSKIVKKGRRLQFRQAEPEDLDYIMETEYKPENAKYVIFAGGIYFAGKEWQKKATGKMIMMIVVAAVLFVLTLDPQTVLQPVGQKLFL